MHLNIIFYYLKENFTYWTSENKKIDNFIQEMQLKTDYYVIEWIPYNQFNCRSV